MSSVPGTPPPPRDRPGRLRTTRGGLGAFVAAVLIAGCAAALARPSGVRQDAPQSASDWAGMSPPRRDAYMREAVMPEMKRLFLEFDRHRYPNMDCVPCHVRQPDPPDYRMPNDDLLLDPSTCLVKDGGDPAMAAMNDFMERKVEPTMARLLGKQPGELRCYVCHVPDR